MWKKLLDSIPVGFARKFINALNIIFVIGGYVFVLVCAIHEEGVSKGVLNWCLISVAGTVCFLIMPMFFVVCRIFASYGPLAYLPYLMVLGIGNLFGEHNAITLTELLLGVIGFAWGILNVAIAKRADEFLVYNGISGIIG